MCEKLKQKNKNLNARKKRKKKRIIVGRKFVFITKKMLELMEEMEAKIAIKKMCK